MITILKFLLVVSYVLCSLALVFVVLLQQGKGAGLGASLGGGGSQTLFGSRAPTFISRFTGVLAAGFFLGAIVLAKWPPFSPSGAVDSDEILQIEEVVVPEEAATPDPEATVTDAQPAESPELDAALPDTQAVVDEVETAGEAVVEATEKAVSEAAETATAAADDVAAEAANVVDEAVDALPVAEELPATPAPTPAQGE